MPFLSIRAWKEAHETLFALIEKAQPNYNFFGGRTFLLANGEKISLSSLKGKIEKLFAKSELFLQNDKKLERSNLNEQSILPINEQVIRYWHACSEHIKTKRLYDSPKNRAQWVERIDRLDRDSETAFYASSRFFLTKIFFKSRSFLRSFFYASKRKYQPSFLESEELHALTYHCLDVMEEIFEQRLRQFILKAHKTINRHYEKAQLSFFSHKDFALSAQDCSLLQEIVLWMQNQLEQKSLPLAFEKSWPESFQELASYWQRVLPQTNEKQIRFQKEHLHALHLFCIEQKKEFPERSSSDHFQTTTTFPEKEIDAENEKQNSRKNLQKTLNYLRGQSVERLHVKMDLEKNTEKILSSFRSFLHQTVS